MAARWRKMDNKTLTIAVLAMAVVGLAGATAYYQHQSTQTLEALQVNAPAQMDAKAQAAASGAEKNKPILIFDYCIAEGNEIDDLALTRIRASVLEIGANSKPEDESYKVAKEWLEETVVPIEAVKSDANPDMAESIKTCNLYRNRGSLFVSTRNFNLQITGHY